jgi:ethanolamine utilization protein EutN
MFLARIDGTLTSTVKHETLEGCRFLIGQRLGADGGAIGDPLVLVDTLGAARGTTVLVTTDNETLRTRVGKTTPARMIVVGLVDPAVGVGQASSLRGAFSPARQTGRPAARRSAR